MLVDSHCHLDRLDLEPFDGSLSKVIAAAAEQGVGEMLCVCINMDNVNTVLDIAREFDNVYASVGVHPNDKDDEEASVEQLCELASAPEVVAIGETGLDYFRSEGDLEWQRERFRTHIAAAREINKPLIIHTREVKDDTLRIMREEGADAVGGVMHCFVDDWETARQALDLGFYISFSGIITFNNAKQVREVAARVPADRLLVETDAPYLAPVPHRGKPNYPAYVRNVAERLAEVRETTLETITELTTANFQRLFKSA